MKGFILAGGKGSRLFPLTKITNKHLLPIFDAPMIYYPIQCLVDAGVCDILIVTGGNYAGDFLQLLGTGHQLGIADAIGEFEKQPKGATILLKEVHDPERFGVAELLNGHVVNIVEKPAEPKSNHAVTGIYMYDNATLDKIKTLVPSSRGELEITDVNNAYIRDRSPSYSFLEGWCTDAGTFDSLFRASTLVSESRKN